MKVSDAIILEPRLYYDEAEECILCRDVGGIALNVAALDPDPLQIHDMKINKIVVYVIEIETMEGQNGRWST